MERNKRSSEWRYEPNQLCLLGLVTRHGIGWRGEGGGVYSGGGGERGGKRNCRTKYMQGGGGDRTFTQ